MSNAQSILCIINGQRVRALLVQQYLDGDARVDYMGTQYMVRAAQIIDGVPQDATRQHAGTAPLPAPTTKLPAARTARKTVQSPLSAAHRNAPVSTDLDTDDEAARQVLRVIAATTGINS